MSRDGRVAAVYCDGGLIQCNPSPIGGTWAWVAVNAEGHALIQASGTLWADPGAVVTNNRAELEAAIQALGSMLPGWAGTLYTDSRVCLGWLGRLPDQVRGWRLNRVPLAVRERLAAQLGRLGAFTGVLLGGHPTQAELAAGVNRKGVPVSPWQVACHDLCTFQAQLEEHDPARGPRPPCRSRVMTSTYPIPLPPGGSL